MYLATTSDCSLWEGDNVLLLGEWCKTPFNKVERSSFKIDTFPPIWENPQMIGENILYCHETYKILLQVLTSKLNECHAIKKSEAYYEIILGYWLHTFIHQARDKYLTLKKVMLAYKDIITCGVEGPATIPLDPTDAISIIQTDEFALHMYSDISEHIGLKIVSKKKENKQHDEVIYKKQYSFSEKLNDILLKAFSYLSGIGVKKEVLLVKPYFSSHTKKSFFELIKSSQGKILFSELTFEYSIKTKINKKQRSESLDIQGDEFQRFLAKIVLKHIPITFLEGYKSLVDQVDNIKLPKSINTFFTRSAINSHLIYKFLLARNINDVQNIVMQHGGGYGIKAYSLAEIYETSVSNKFYTFGWNDRFKLPMPLNTFISKNQNKIVFGTNEHPRYLVRIDNHPITSQYINETVKNWFNFFNQCSFRNEIQFRCQGLGKSQWDYPLEKLIHDNQIDNFSQSFLETLKETKLFITDQCETTFLESLAYNVPTVVYFTKKYYDFRDECKFYIDALHKAKIVHYDPLEAAKFCNEIVENIEEWWFSDLVQNARQNFIKKYMWTETEWSRYWVDAITSNTI